MQDRAGRADRARQAARDGPGEPAADGPGTRLQALARVLATTARCGLYLWLVVVTGVRRGELCGLQIRDVDLDRALVHIRFKLRRSRRRPRPQGHQDPPGPLTLRTRPGRSSTSRADGTTPRASSSPAGSTCGTPPHGSATAAAARPRCGTTPTRSPRSTGAPPPTSRSQPPDPHLRAAKARGSPGYIGLFIPKPKSAPRHPAASPSRLAATVGRRPLVYMLGCRACRSVGHSALARSRQVDAFGVPPPPESEV
jgi:hypothetical protein